MRRLFVGPLSVLRLAYLLENCRLLCVVKMRKLAALPVAVIMRNLAALPVAPIIIILSAHLTAAVYGVDAEAFCGPFVCTQVGISPGKLSASVCGEDAGAGRAPCGTHFSFCAPDGCKR